MSSVQVPGSGWLRRRKAIRPLVFSVALLAPRLPGLLFALFSSSSTRVVLSLLPGPVQFRVFAPSSVLGRAKVLPRCLISLSKVRFTSVQVVSSESCPTSSVICMVRSA